MEFTQFITAFLLLIVIFFFGLIVGFQMGRKQEREDADRRSTRDGVIDWRTRNMPYDQGPAKNSPEREDAISRKLQEAPGAEERRIADRMRAEDRLRYDRERRS